MALRDLVPWKDGSRNVSVQSNETGNPFLALHREMNRMFDESLRSFDIGSFGSPAMMGWPSVELNETKKEVKVVAELPGLDQNDVAIELWDGVLTISRLVEQEAAVPPHAGAHGAADRSEAMAIDDTCSRPAAVKDVHRGGAALGARVGVREAKGEPAAVGRHAHAGIESVERRARPARPRDE